MDKQIYIQDVPSIELGGQTYTTSDDSLITSFNTDITFNPATDYVEYYVYNADKQIVDTVEKLNSFAIYGEDLSISPEQDLENRAYTDGKYYTVYNFLRPLLASNILETYYISEISLDRTEIRLASTSILGGDIVDSTLALKADLDSAPYQKDFSLNFGNNNLIIANNILLDETNPTNVTVLVKLYEPLPSIFDIQSQCWAVEKISESKAYLINIQTEYKAEDTTIKLKGPNLNLLQNSEINKSTEYQTVETLKQNTTASLKYQLNSILAETGVELNIDYSDYNNFVFFSSAQTRLENFYYKLGLLEEYTVSASYGSSSTGYYNSSSVSYWDNKINEVITNFDGYEYYLYFESSSTAWPKSNNTPPYTNVSTTSVEGTTWLNSQLTVAELYDENNKDGLVSSIPLYIREDSANLNFELFVEMVGQHFDSIWVYSQAVTEKYNSDNRVESGLSKDLVGTALKDFGIKLYQNNFTSDNLYNTYLGYTPSGSLLPYTGQELITNYVTASATGSLIPVDNLSSEIYKRLYHNLPYLLKKKGTVEGLNTLITTFGIPDTILRVYEYGGKDEDPNTFDQWQQQYDLTFTNTGSSYVTSSFVLNTAWGATSNRPSAVEFKFKTEGIPAATHYSQSLWSTNNGVVALLKYTGSAYVSGSYSGSVVDPYNQYGVLEFYPSSSNTATTASIYLPFFDGGWWSVLINKNSSTEFTLYAKNSLYTGNDGNTLGFQASSSTTLANPWTTATEAYLGKSLVSSKVFSGSLQELRYYTQPISESTFDAYVMNPGSIEQSEYLAFRGSLGGELYTASISIHPKVSGEQNTTSSFAASSNFYISGSTTYTPNVSTVFYDQPIAGIKNAVSDKIKVQATNLYGTTLSGLNTLQQNSPLSGSYTRDVNYLEVGFSPQNEINEDINSQFGYFNIGEYIGDPRFISESAYNYPNLNQISLDYFKKYSSSYNYVDYFRLIKFFDNSLFKLIKDFIPARTSAATGAIVKQHLLERNRQRPAQVDYTQPEYTGSITSLARDYQTGSIEVFTGGPGGSVDAWLNISQSWSSSINTKAGIVNTIQSSEYEFYNGEYSGSAIPCHISYSLNYTPLLNNVSSSRVSTVYEDIDYGTNAFNPVNLTFIQSGSASAAPIQDSNYAITSSWSRLRYEGSENIGQLNSSILFASTSQAPGYPVDEFTSYFAYYDWIGGSDPEYPGGANIHITKLINAETKEIITLSKQNKNLDTISRIFRKGDIGYIVPSAIGNAFTVNIVEGGALYQTIFAKTGSVANFEVYRSGSNTSAIYVPYFHSQSRSTFNDTGSIFRPWLYPLLTITDSVSGSIATYNFNYLNVYNPNTGDIVPTGDPIAPTDTLFPLENYDFIRIADTGSSISSSLDNTFTALGLYQIKTAYTASTSNGFPTSSIEIVPYMNDSTAAATDVNTADNQTFRVFRKIPNETFILINTQPSVGPGVLVPYNLNPKYSPNEIATELGL